MKAKTISLALAVPMLLLLARCGTDNIAGNGTQTGNPTVVGTLYEPDGVTPAAGVRVVIRPKKSLADTSGTGLTKRLAAVDSVTTDSAGRYAFDSTLDTGTYVIEAASGNDAVLIDSVAVTSQDSTDSLPPDTLKPAGALKGIIKLSEGGDPRKVFVLAFGIDRFARVEADGRFRFQNLAEAAYDLRIISSLDDYGVLDTVGVPVRSADTTNLDTISLPFTGIPTPRGLTINYDTLRQIVTLTWNKADTALVKGYNVYRRNVDSNTVLTRINTTPITDTIYQDSTGIQDQTYEYKIVAVSKQDMEGTKSAALSTKIIGSFGLAGSFGSAGSGDGQFQNPTGLALGSDSSVFVVDVNNNRLQKFDFNGTFLTKTGTAGSDTGQFNAPLDVAIDKDGNIFVADQQNNRIQKLSKEFAVVAIQDSGVQRPKTIAVDSKGNVYINEMSSPTIKKYNRELQFLLEWGHGGNDSSATGSPQSIAIDSLDRIYVVDNPTNKIAVFDTTGTFLRSIAYSSFGVNDQVNIQDISISGEKVFATDSYNKRILVLSLDGKLITEWGDSNFSSIVALPNGNVWVTVYPEQKVTIYER